jgi:serine/threonine-protein kinase
MTPERYQQIDQVFQDALALDPEQRAAYLDTACSGDEALRNHVESLITSDREGLSFIDETAFEMAARVLASDDPALSGGDRIDRYEIVSLLGSGGMGEVYLAHDQKLNRKIALKLLPVHFTTNQERLRRFQQEAQAASALNHPNIITIHEIGQVEDRHFIATEFVDGETLRQRLKRGGLSLSESLDIAVQVCGALAAAHKAGIVHRDIKPENIMLRPDSYVKVVDFGLAKLGNQSEPAADAWIADDADVSSGLVMGTVKYMSPEQAQGLPVDQRSDIFSLGVVLYEMLTGHTPFEGESARELIRSMAIRLPPLTEYLPTAPKDLQRIVSKALAHDKSKRYQAAEDFLDDLKVLRQQAEVGVGPRTSSQLPAGNDVSTRIQHRRTTSVQDSAFGIAQRKFVGATVIIMLVVVGAIVFRAYLHEDSSGVPIESIAVLPFENQNHDPERDYISDGLAESIINSLTRLPNLKVSARSSVFRYKGKQTDPVAAGKELGVRAVLTGRIMQRGDGLRVSTELIDVNDNKQLWAQQYDERASSLLSLQQDIATNIVANLRLKLSSTDRNRVNIPFTENPEAYRLYLKGRYFWNKRTEEGVAKAAEYFQQAIDLDPQYSRAYVGLADCYLFGQPPLPPRVLGSRAKSMTKKALEIDDTLGEGYATLGLIAENIERDLPEAEREYKRAIELNPNYATAHQWYGEYLSLLGRFNEALAEMKLANELDPLSLVIIKDTGEVYYVARQYDESIEYLHKALEMDPNFFIARVNLGLAYAQKGKFSAAVDELQKARQVQDGPEILSQLGYVYGLSGQKREAQNMLGELRLLSKQRHVVPGQYARIYAGLGEKDKALDYLEEDFREGTVLSGLKVDPQFDLLRSDPRFLYLMKQIGLTP